MRAYAAALAALALLQHCALASSQPLNASYNWPNLHDSRRVLHLHFAIESKDYADIVADSWYTLNVPALLWSDEDGGPAAAAGTLVAIRCRTAPPLSGPLRSTLLCLKAAGYSGHMLARPLEPPFVPSSVRAPVTCWKSRAAASLLA